MQPKEIVDVGLFLGEWSRCTTAQYQWDQLYRTCPSCNVLTVICDVVKLLTVSSQLVYLLLVTGFGKFDDCGRQWQDVRNALSAKFSRDEAEARKLVERTYHHKRTTISPTIGVIWEAKAEPGWK